MAQISAVCWRRRLEINDFERVAHQHQVLELQVAMAPVVAVEIGDAQAKLAPETKHLAQQRAGTSGAKHTAFHADVALLNVFLGLCRLAVDGASLS